MSSALASRCACHKTCPRHSIIWCCASCSESNFLLNVFAICRMPGGWSIEICSLMDRCMERWRKGFVIPFSGVNSCSRAPDGSLKILWNSGCCSIHWLAIISSGVKTCPSWCFCQVEQKNSRTSSRDGLNRATYFSSASFLFIRTKGLNNAMCTIGITGFADIATLQNQPMMRIV